MKEIVLSGIRPTGNLHLGNYYGAVQSFVKMQEDYNCFYFIAALTHNPSETREHTELHTHHSG